MLLSWVMCFGSGVPGPNPGHINAGNTYCVFLLRLELHL